MTTLIPIKTKDGYRFKVVKDSQAQMIKEIAAKPLTKKRIEEVKRRFKVIRK